MVVVATVRGNLQIFQQRIFRRRVRLVARQEVALVLALVDERMSRVAVRLDRSKPDSTILVRFSPDGIHHLGASLSSNLTSKFYLYYHLREVFGQTERRKHSCATLN